ncbi:hypothetical protein DUNSADRAFT_15082 [Dunaliella salina]|uniref:Uncharacterized protein n=1 Tax=Dunaliella salina TaxID=3046 RepID=A0ABQ7G602_DUNSA|nr:hypothetical protein DUNSADRAFT_15082 [Dunaliella salina]|eukprot:KAF5830041.1 hypothetical protein DUNSADRAFT_15082 [Dunaliella salina]
MISYSYEELGLTRERFERLVIDHVPIFHLDKKEKYGPCSVEWFLERASLVERGKDGPASVFLPRGQVRQEQLLDMQLRHSTSNQKKRLALWLDDKDIAGPNPVFMDDVPVYVHVKAICWPDGVPEALEMNYMTLFAFNGAYPLFGLPCLLAGAHQGDWEHCTVRLRLQDLALMGVWYNSHRNLEGEWRACKDVQRDPSGRILSFVARNGHGMYPQPGIVFRIFCAANDFTSAHGRVWRPKRVVRMCGIHGTRIPACTSRGCGLPNPPCNTSEPYYSRGAQSEADCPVLVEDFSLWQRWNGSWGTSHNPPRQSWFNNPEPLVSRTFCQRLICPLAKGVDTLIPLEKEQHQKRQGATCNRSMGNNAALQLVSKDAGRGQAYDTMVIARPLDPGWNNASPGGVVAGPPLPAPPMER